MSTKGDVAKSALRGYGRRGGGARGLKERMLEKLKMHSNNTDEKRREKQQQQQPGACL